MALRRGHLECGANCWPTAVTSSQHVYVVGPRKDKRGVDLISDALESFDCQMANDPTTINKESTNENNTDADRWADARRLRINGKPYS